MPRIDAPDVWRHDVNLPKKKPRGVNGGAKFSFLTKEVAANAVIDCDGFLLLLDVDLVFLVVIFLLASKSCVEPFALPTAATLRLGKKLKASLMPIVLRPAYFQHFRAKGATKKMDLQVFCKENRHFKSEYVMCCERSTLQNHDNHAKNARIYLISARRRLV